MKIDYDKRCINLRLHHIPLRSYSSLDKEGLGLKLLSIARHIGVKTPPSADKDIPALIEFVCGHYGFITGDEIAYAFELSAAGKLSKALEHYNSFNIRVLGDTLKQYGEYYKQQYRAYKQEQEQAEEEEARKQAQEPTETEMQGAYERILKHAQEFGHLPVTDRWDLALRHCERSGLISVTNAEKTRLMDHYRPIVQRDQLIEEKTANRGAKVAPATTEQITGYTQTECRKHLLKQHLSLLLKTTILTWKEAQILRA